MELEGSQLVPSKEKPVFSKIPFFPQTQCPAESSAHQNSLEGSASHQQPADPGEAPTALSPIIRNYCRLSEKLSKREEGLTNPGGATGHLFLLM